MEGDVLKSFLVGLGFGVDDASLAKFNKAINSASTRVAAMYAGITTAAAGIFYSISKMSEGFEDVGYQLRLVQPAINKFLILRQAMISAYQAAGVNLVKAVQQSILFNLSLAKTKYALEAVYKSVGVKFLPLLTQQMDIFRAKIFANMPKIQAVLTSFVTLIFKAFEVTYELGYRAWKVLEILYGIFQRLDAATGGWSTKLLAFAAAWKILNLGFLATPFGMVIAGLVALLSLYDDLMVFKSGGQSLIDWGSDTTKMIVGMIYAVGVVVGAFYAWAAAAKVVEGALVAWELVLGVLNGELGIAAGLLAFIEAPIWLIVAAIGALVGALTLADKKWNIFGGKVAGFFGMVGGKIIDTIGGGNAGVNTANVAAPQPLLSTQGGSTQNVSQATSIVVQGSADAGATGKAVAAQQSNVNFDMGRNLKGAMK